MRLRPKTSFRRASICSAVYAAAFQYIGTHILVLHIRAESATGEGLAGDLVVQVGRELEPPAVEHKIQYNLFPGIPIDGDGAVVSGPGVIDGTFHEADSICGGEAAAAKVFFAFGLVPADHQHGFVA